MNCKECKYKAKAFGTDKACYCYIQNKVIMSVDNCNIVEDAMEKRFGKRSSEMSLEELMSAISETATELYAKTGDDKYNRVRRFTNSKLNGNDNNKALNDAFSDEVIERKYN